MMPTVTTVLLQPWDEFMLLMHIGAALVAGALFCSAPDKTQKWVLGTIIVAMLVLVIYYALRTCGYVRWWMDDVKMLGYAIDHAAILLFLTRLFWKERLSCKNLSRNSPYFQD
jgi:hypothetical protein